MTKPSAMGSAVTAPDVSRRGPETFLMALGAVLLAGLALRGLRLNDGLWMDEGISVTFVTEAHDLRGLLRNLSTTDTSERLQQLYVIVLYYWCALFGDSTVSLRVMSLLPGVATILLVADAARRLYPSPGAGRKAAFWAVLLASGSAYLIYFSTEIRAAALLAMLTALFIDGWIADRQSAVPRLTPLLVCVVSSALLCVGSIYGVIPLAALGVCDTRMVQAPRRWWRFWPVAAIFCVAVCAVFYAPALMRSDVRELAGVVQSQGLLQSILFVIYGITVGQSYGPPLEALHGPDRARIILQHAPALLAYAVAMAGVTLLVLRRLRRVGQAELLAPLTAALILSLVLGAGLGWLENLNWLPRHAFYLAPLFLIVLAGALGEHGAAAAPRWGIVAVVALIAMNLLAVFNFNFREAYALDDYRGVARMLRAPPYQDAVPVMLSGNLQLLRDYYGVTGLVDAREVRAPTLDAMLPKLTDNARDVVVVVNREFFWTGALDRSLPDVYTGPAYAVGDHQHLVYFDLYRLTRR